jgi:hypothetical protein
MNRWLTGWASRGNPLIFYDYPPSGSNFDVVIGFAERYKSLIAYTKAAGVVGWSGEGQGSWAGAGLWQYVKARLLWDAGAEVKELIAEFCRDLYGPAAGSMAEFYGTLDGRIGVLDGHPVWGKWAAELPASALEALSAILTRAEAESDGSPCRRNVAMVRVAFNALEIARLSAGSGRRAGPSAFDRYTQLRTETLALIKQYSVPVTDRWRDQLARNPYRPPFEALNAELLMDLTTSWRFRTDPDDEGEAAEWFRVPDTENEPWRDIRVDQYWTEQGIQYHGVAWYATSFTAPKKADGQVWLLFGMIDGAAAVWIDGKPVGKLPGDPWDRPKAFDVTRFIRPGQKTLLTVRVEKMRYAAGINGGVRLTGGAE